MTVRVGQGFDVHAFSEAPDRVLVLGGVVFDGEPGLVGHSDADVVAHACADALLGAAGLGDIGALFPDTDERWRVADSVAMLAAAARLVRGARWTPANLGCTAVLMNTGIAGAQKPVLMAEAMRLAVDGGRKAFLAGRMPRQDYANASSPTSLLIE
jgi:2-C-methyl-D-erythritol 2,4-cyclodiphosphate synthase